MLPDAHTASAVDTDESDVFSQLCCKVNDLKVLQQVCVFGREEITYVLSDTQLFLMLHDLSAI